MKTSTKNKVAITTVCIMLGVILAVQFKSIDDLDTNVVSTQRSKKIAIEYKKLKKEKQTMEKQIDQLEQKVSLYEADQVKEDPFLESLYQDIDKYKNLSGYKDLRGSGVVIEIDNPSLEIELEDEKNTMINHYTFLLEIISLLNAVDTEAISINEQRYTSYTEIVPAGNVLEINGTSVSTPVIIKAIGDADDIENALRLKGGIIWLMEEGYNFNININQKKDINILKTKEIKTFKYAEPIDENNK